MDEQTKSIVLVITDRGLLFEAGGVADILSRANREAGREVYRVTVATPHRHGVIRGASGLRVLADACLLDLDPNEPRDTIIVTGASSTDDHTVVIDWFRRAAVSARRVVSVCRGAFILAAAGLLEGRRATTHWLSLPDLSRNYPGVIVENDAIYVRDDPIWTSAGASSGLDLTLALVEDDLGASVARTVAQYLVLYLRRPGGQSQFSHFLDGEVPLSDPLKALQVWMTEHLSDDLRVDTLAGQAAMSPRNFFRVFLKETGVPPAEFVERLRFEEARKLLEQTRDTVESIASAVGVGTALSLRRLFERRAGVTPGDYRQRFGMK